MANSSPAQCREIEGKESYKGKVNFKMESQKQTKRKMQKQKEEK